MAEQDPNSQFTPIDPAEFSPPPRRRRWYEYLGFSRDGETPPPPMPPSPPTPEAAPVATTAPISPATATDSTPSAPLQEEPSTGPIRKLTDLKTLQRFKNYIFGALAVGALILGLQFANPSQQELIIEDPAKRGQAGTLLPNIDRDRENWIVRSDALFEKQQKAIEDLKRQTESDHKQLDDVVQAIKQSGGSLSHNSDGTVTLKMPAATPKDDPSTTMPPAPKPSGPQLPDVAPPTTAPLAPMPAMQEPPLAPTIRSFKPMETSALMPGAGGQPAKPNTIGALAQQTTPLPLTQGQRIGIREDDIWIPTGTFVKARLLSGLMAPTGTRASQNPHPVLLELTEDGIGPNKTRLPTKDCFVIGSAVGDLSSERALIRTETLSCVRPDKSTVDIDMKGYVAGDDGINGIRGTIVSKQGSLLAQSMLAGFAKGLSDVMRYQASSVVISPAGAMTTMDPSQAMKGGALGGVGQSMDRLANFYITLAEEVFPCIEVSAGRVVDVVITKGMIPL